LPDDLSQKAKRNSSTKRTREFQSPHASTLIALPGRTFWPHGLAGAGKKGRTWRSGVPRTAAGWQKPWIAADTRAIALWNPVFVPAAGRRIFLYYKEGVTIPSGARLVKYSDDDGKTFSEAKDLSPAMRAGAAGEK
jgi:hypothetical protein